MASARLPSFKLLIGFEAAARLGNYSRAAEELFVSQSAISHQISQLEQQLGQPLFRRHGRGVELTVAGQLLQESVTRSLEQIRNGLRRIDTYFDDSLVTLVCPATVAQGWLQPQLAALRREHPALCPIVSIDETARFIDELDVDICIARGPLRQPGVLERPFLEDALVPVATPALAARLRPRKPEDHGRHAGLLCLESDLTGEVAGPFIREHFGGLHRVAIYDDARLLLDAALRGHGLAVLPRLLAHEALDLGQLRLVKPYPHLPLETLWLARAEGDTRLPLVREVFDSLCRTAPALPVVPAG